MRCWNANMDIQFVTDAYACVVYIVSYISKSEREMGLLLSHAHKEAYSENNVEVKDALKSVSRVYMQCREVSAQEAVYRACAMHLKECSRKVQFIPTGDNQIRLTKPLALINNTEEDSDIWMTSLNERYRARPDESEFNNMCLATFAAEYIIVYGQIPKDKKQIGNPVWHLQNDLGKIRKRSRSDSAVIRYPRFSVTSYPEKHYRTALELFLPHRKDTDLLPNNFKLYQKYFENGTMLINGNLMNIHDVVNKNREIYETDVETLEEAEKMVKENGVFEDPWAELCPESEKERLECITEQEEQASDDLNEHDASDINIPDLRSSDKIFATEKNPDIWLTKEFAIPKLQSMNDQQTTIFYSIRQWCLEKCRDPNSLPFRLFLTGGAGVGKSHLIKCIYYEANRIFRHFQERPDDVSVLLCAPTGVAAFNINGCTIHNALSLGIDISLPYVPLGEDKINTLRTKLASLKILIIDEISMVDHKMLAYIHGRLKQVNRTADDVLFGNIAILAVGDFYQLPPVKGRALYKSNPLDLWSEEFTIADLTKNERQSGDLSYANALNTLRTRVKNDSIPEDVLSMLKSRETGEEIDAIHIYATNVEVNEFNLKMLHEKCDDIIQILSKDYQRDQRTGSLAEKQFTGKLRDTSLSSSLAIAVGARVMLTHNIEVSDGLVNGATGKIQHIERDNDEKVTMIYVLFDNERVGAKYKKQHKDVHPGSVGIEIREDNFHNRNKVRKQFPLKLAYASTVHKVQGLSLQSAHISMKSKFFSQKGMAYTALSRLCTLNGVVLSDVDENKIFCDPEISPALASMQQLNLSPTVKSDIAFHNIEGVHNHINDLKNDKRMVESRLICLAETWVCDSNQLPRLQNFCSFNKPRQESFDKSGYYEQFQDQSHGGVGLYYKSSNDFQLIPNQIKNIEFIVCCLDGITIVVIYRSPRYKASTFVENLKKLLLNLSNYDKIIVIGDFNENNEKDKSIDSCFKRYNYVQRVKTYTTEGFTILDKVYVKNVNCNIELIPTYYSYHEAIGISFVNSRTQT